VSGRARLSGTPTVHADCEIVGSSLGRFVEIGRGLRIAQTEVGDYAYRDRFCDIANASVGKFANIAAFVRIGATDHPRHTAALHHFLYQATTGTMPSTARSWRRGQS
jgi:bifunctional N-acetylglucosamine-1-phosphate-uridyltransferase/glucosamine-1-phosphate-acetyltransferase GlmU-like protein